MVAACAVLAACATSPEPAAPTVVRTRAPVAYEKTIDNYLAFRLRNPQKNTRISVAPAEPGDCPIDGRPQSIRGWVVPVTHETFSGELTGKVERLENAIDGQGAGGTGPQIPAPPGI